MRIFVEKIRGVFGFGQNYDPDPLYQAIVEQARTKDLYRAPYSVPNTLDGRFDSLCLHMYIVLRHIGDDLDRQDDLSKVEKKSVRNKAQALQNRFFKDMDQTMREIGIGDMTVGKHVTRMAKAYFGRVVAYESAFHDTAELAEKLRANVFRSEAEPQSDEIEASNRLAAYILSLAKGLSTQSMEAVLVGDVEFVQP